jgi:hypothetical protein
MNLKRRLGKLNGVWTDSSGLIPHSTEWVEYWYRRIMLHETDDSQPASRLGKSEFVEILRAVLNYDGPLAIDNEE